MTLEQFFEELKKVKDWKFYFEDDEDIRLYKDGRDYCPVTAVCMNLTGAYYSPDNFVEAAKKIDLETKTAMDIVTAADRDDVSLQTGKIRKELLDSLNAEEPWFVYDEYEDCY